MIIKNLLDKYRSKIDSLDLELIISHASGKPREFVLAHPEFKLNKKQEVRIINYIKRRMGYEPLAYILGYKEFYGLDFKVTGETLIPRPETEMLVEVALNKIEEAKSEKQQLSIVDIGTGSGNIIISLARSSKHKTGEKIFFYGIDKFKKVLRIARHNAKKNNVDKKIKFIQSDLLNYFLKAKSYPPAGEAGKLRAKELILIANLPYLSQKIYSEVSPDVKNFEPKSALLSGKDGLAHYKKLFKQIKKLRVAGYGLRVFLEIGPEQKNKIKKIIKETFPDSKIEFKKDLAGKWRVCKITA